MTTQTLERNGEAHSAPPQSEEERRFSRLAAFNTAEALSALESLIEEVPRLELAISQAKLDLTLAEEAAELREAELAFETKDQGKNAEERKNALSLALSKDEVYQQRKAEVLKVKAKLGEAEREAQTARHRERYWHAFLATRQAQIHYLAK